MPKRNIIIIIIIIFVISVITGAVFAWRAWPLQKTTKSAQDQIDVSGWKTYRNEELGFEMIIPKGWAIFREENDKKPSSPYGGIDYGKVVLGTSFTYNYEMEDGLRVKIAISDSEVYFEREVPSLQLQDTILIDRMDANRYVYYMKGGNEEHGFIQAHGYISQPVREYIVDAYDSEHKRYYHFSLESVGKSVKTSDKFFNTILENFKRL